MTTNTILAWLIVGLVAGVLASVVVGGVGLLGDILIGICGAFVGGWLFRHFGWHAPFEGLAGTIAIAFVGAILLLLIVHLFQGGFYRRGLY